MTGPAAQAADVADAAPADTPAIEVLAAAMTYADGTQALQPIELQVAAGEFVTLLGPSGCGKSTLLKLIAGLLAPSAGRLALWGQPVERLEASGRKLAFVFQAPTLMPWASVRKNVRLPLDLAGLPRAQAEVRAAGALAQVGLTPFAGALPHTLSGGMQMRVSIARSLVTRPDLLLLDEPFGALDEITRHRLDAELLALWQDKRQDTRQDKPPGTPQGSARRQAQSPAQGKPQNNKSREQPLEEPRRGPLTVVFVTHSLHEAVFLSQRVIMMAARPGRVFEELRIDEPYPRTPEFLVSTRFSQYARHLQQSLQRASADYADELAAAGGQRGASSAGEVA